jgi:hypothetical protein
VRWRRDYSKDVGHTSDFDPTEHNITVCEHLPDEHWQSLSSDVAVTTTCTNSNCSMNGTRLTRTLVFNLPIEGFKSKDGHRGGYLTDMQEAIDYEMLEVMHPHPQSCTKGDCTGLILQEMADGCLFGQILWFGLGRYHRLTPARTIYMPGNPRVKYNLVSVLRQTGGRTHFVAEFQHQGRWFSANDIGASVTETSFQAMCADQVPTRAVIYVRDAHQ